MPCIMLSGQEFTSLAWEGAKPLTSFAVYTSEVLLWFWGLRFFQSIPAAMTNLICILSKSVGLADSLHLRTAYRLHVSLNTCLPIAMFIHPAFEPFQGRIRIKLKLRMIPTHTNFSHTDSQPSNALPVVFGEISKIELIYSELNGWLADGCKQHHRPVYPEAFSSH